MVEVFPWLAIAWRAALGLLVALVISLAIVWWRLGK